MLVPDTQEIIAESLYSGNTVSWKHDVFKEMITKMETMLSIQSKKQRNSIRLRLDSADSPSVFKGYKNDICLNDKYVRNS